jgi:hypothetical protein
MVTVVVFWARTGRGKKALAQNKKMPRRMQPTLKIFVASCFILAPRHQKLSPKSADVLAVQKHVKALACIIANPQIDGETKNSIITICSFFMFSCSHISYWLCSSNEYGLTLTYMFYPSFLATLAKKVYLVRACHSPANAAKMFFSV